MGCGTSQQLPQSSPVQLPSTHEKALWTTALNNYRHSIVSGGDSRIGSLLPPTTNQPLDDELSWCELSPEPQPEKLSTQKLSPLRELSPEIHRRNTATQISVLLESSASDSGSGGQIYDGACGDFNWKTEDVERSESDGSEEEGPEICEDKRAANEKKVSFVHPITQAKSKETLLTPQPNDIQHTDASVQAQFCCSQPQRSSFTQTGGESPLNYLSPVRIILDTPSDKLSESASCERQSSLKVCTPSPTPDFCRQKDASVQAEFGCTHPYGLFNIQNEMKPLNVSQAVVNSPSEHLSESVSCGVRTPPESCSPLPPPSVASYRSETCSIPNESSQSLDMCCQPQMDSSLKAKDFIGSESAPSQTSGTSSINVSITLKSPSTPSQQTSYSANLKPGSKNGKTSSASCHSQISTLSPNQVQQPAMSVNSAAVIPVSSRQSNSVSERRFLSVSPSHLRSHKSLQKRGRNKRRKKRPKEVSKPLVQQIISNSSWEKMPTCSENSSSILAISPTTPVEDLSRTCQRSASGDLSPQGKVRSLSITMKAKRTPSLKPQPEIKTHSSGNVSIRLARRRISSLRKSSPAVLEPSTLISCPSSQSGSISMRKHSQGKTLHSFQTVPSEPPEIDCKQLPTDFPSIQLSSKQSANNLPPCSGVNASVERPKSSFCDNLKRISSPVKTDSTACPLPLSKTASPTSPISAVPSLECGNAVNVPNSAENCSQRFSHPPPVTAALENFKHGCSDEVGVSRQTRRRSSRTTSTLVKIQRSSSGQRAVSKSPQPMDELSACLVVSPLLQENKHCSGDRIDDKKVVAKSTSRNCVEPVSNPRNSKPEQSEFSNFDSTTVHSACALSKTCLEKFPPYDNSLKCEETEPAINTTKCSAQISKVIRLDENFTSTAKVAAASPKFAFSNDSVCQTTAEIMQLQNSDNSARCADVSAKPESSSNLFNQTPMLESPCPPQSLECPDSSSNRMPPEDAALTSNQTTRPPTQQTVTATISPPTLLITSATPNSPTSFTSSFQSTSLPISGADPPASQRQTPLQNSDSEIISLGPVCRSNTPRETASVPSCKETAACPFQEMGTHSLSSCVKLDQDANSTGKVSAKCSTPPVVISQMQLMSNNNCCLDNQRHSTKSSYEDTLSQISSTLLKCGIAEYPGTQLLLATSSKPAGSTTLMVDKACQKSVSSPSPCSNLDLEASTLRSNNQAEKFLEFDSKNTFVQDEKLCFDVDLLNSAQTNRLTEQKSAPITPSNASSPQTMPTSAKHDISTTESLSQCSRKTFTVKAADPPVKCSNSKGLNSNNSSGKTCEEDSELSSRFQQSYIRDDFPTNAAVVEPSMSPVLHPLTTATSPDIDQWSSSLMRSVPLENSAKITAHPSCDMSQKVSCLSKVSPDVHCIGAEQKNQQVQPMISNNHPENHHLAQNFPVPPAPRTTPAQAVCRFSKEEPLCSSFYDQPIDVCSHPRANINGVCPEGKIPSVRAQPFDVSQSIKPNHSVEEAETKCSILEAFNLKQHSAIGCEHLPNVSRRLPKGDCQNLFTESNKETNQMKDENSVAGENSVHNIEPELYPPTPVFVCSSSFAEDLEDNILVCNETTSVKDDSLSNEVCKPVTPLPWTPLVVPAPSSVATLLHVAVNNGYELPLGKYAKRSLHTEPSFARAVLSSSLGTAKLCYPKPKFLTQPRPFNMDAKKVEDCAMPVEQEDVTELSEQTKPEVCTVTPKTSQVQISTAKNVKRKCKAIVPKEIHLPGLISTPRTCIDEAANSVKAEPKTSPCNQPVSVSTATAASGDTKPRQCSAFCENAVKPKGRCESTNDAAEKLPCLPSPTLTYVISPFECSMTSNANMCCKSGYGSRITINVAPSIPTTNMCQRYNSNSCSSGVCSNCANSTKPTKTERKSFLKQSAIRLKSCWLSSSESNKSSSSEPSKDSPVDKNQKCESSATNSVATYTISPALSSDPSFPTQVISLQQTAEKESHKTCTGKSNFCESLPTSSQCNKYKTGLSSRMPKQDNLNSNSSNSFSECQTLTNTKSADNLPDLQESVEQPVNVQASGHLVGANETTKIASQQTRQCWATSSQPLSQICEMKEMDIVEKFRPDTDEVLQGSDIKQANTLLCSCCRKPRKDNIPGGDGDSCTMPTDGTICKVCATCSSVFTDSRETSNSLENKQPPTMDDAKVSNKNKCLKQTFKTNRPAVEMAKGEEYPNKCNDDAPTVSSIPVENDECMPVGISNKCLMRSSNRDAVKNDKIRH